MTGSFTIKTIKLTLTYSGKQHTVEGLACTVDVTKPGLPEKNSASVSVWGLKYELMEELTMLAFRPLESEKNQIMIEAGDKDGQLSVVFKGEIVSASADYNDAPNIAMKFEAESGAYPQQIAEPVLTVDGEAKASDLFSKWASAMGYAFKDENLTASVKNAWFSGSPINKAYKLSRDINCELYIDDDQVVVMPAGQAREGNAVLLNKDSGLIGYPVFNQDGIVCRCLYNPDLIYGGLVKVESIVPKASGVWRITKLTHSLSAYEPSGGNWESQIEAQDYE
jgi:hypothetical protein